MGTDIQCFAAEKTGATDLATIATALSLEQLLDINVFFLETSQDGILESLDRIATKLALRKGYIVGTKQYQNMVWKSRLLNSFWQSLMNKVVRRVLQSVQV